MPLNAFEFPSRRHRCPQELEPERTIAELKFCAFCLLTFTL